MKLKPSPGQDSLQVIKYFFIVLILIIIVLAALTAIVIWRIAPRIPADDATAALGVITENLAFMLLVVLAVAATGTGIFAGIALRSRRLNEQVKLNEQLLDMPGLAILVHDAAGNRLFANKLAEQYFGGLNDRVRSKAGAAPEFVKLIKPRMDELMAKNELTFEATHTRDGVEVPVEVFSRATGSGTSRFVLSVIQDIGERKRTEEELRTSSDKIRRAMDGTIRTMSLTAEIRDPYTAGHQQRVAKLAVALGREIGLSENQLKGLEVAGTLHDIGKIYVPAEILSKPGKLRKNEFNIIKDHAEVGYDLLKTIEFPWPVAQMVLQHHERLDGSGYPNGMTGDNIMIEARIMGVADVVEAMATHRPYRPAMNIEKALLELIQRKGTLYDAAVVDACVRLVSDKGFKFD
jgi:PAS domain S-box-containing protein/putative nucleotidyltransferase with HDIG domain